MPALGRTLRSHTACMKIRDYFVRLRRAKMPSFFCAFAIFISSDYICSPKPTPWWWNGRHEGLKIPWAARPVRVRVPSEARKSRRKKLRLFRFDLRSYNITSHNPTSSPSPAAGLSTNKSAQGRKRRRLVSMRPLLFSIVSVKTPYIAAA